MYFSFIFLICVIAAIFLLDLFICIQHGKKDMTYEELEKFLPIAVQCGYVTEKEATEFKERNNY